jgi:uncharacterized protein (TIGR03086 family)
MSSAPDPRQLLRQSLEQAGALIRAVPVAQFDLATPCDEFDVRALIGHMAFAAKRIAAAGRRDKLPDDGPSVTGVADEDWPATFDAIASDVTAAWARDGALDGEVALPFGTFPAPVVVLIYAQEQVTHGWDLAAATGQIEALDPALAEALLPVVRVMVPADVRGGEMPFEPVVPVATDAPAYDRLAGFLGRTPVAP